MNDIIKSIWNYVLSVILLVAGFLFLSMYLRSSGLEKQPQEMLFGALFLILAGILALPIVAHKIRKGLAFMVGGLCLVAAVFLIYSLDNVIDEEIQFQEDFKAYSEVTKQRLIDIRTAQEQYVKVNGTYTESFETLLAFINEPSIPKVFRIGKWDLRRVGPEANDTIRDGTFEEYFERGFVIGRADLDSVAQLESERLGYEVSAAKLEQMMRANETNYRVQDTTFVSVYDEYFSDDKRAEEELPAIEISQLPFNPHPLANGSKFIMMSSSIPSGEAGLTLPTIVVKDANPFGREGVKRDTLMFGSLIEAKTDGNWARE